MTSSSCQLIHIAGGASSGKSQLALQMARQGELEAGPYAFVATAESRDAEMAEKIRRHQAARGGGWITEEVPVQLAEWFQNRASLFPVVVVDCLTLWLSNVQEQGCQDEEIRERVRTLLMNIRRTANKVRKVIVVSNELGLGLVPMDSSARHFRTVAGEVNQLVAAEADEVFFCLMGQPLKIK